MPQDMPERISEYMPDRVPERMPEDMPDRMPDRMPEDMYPHGNFPIENGVTQVTPFFRQKMLEQSFSLHFPGKVRKVLHDFICKCI